MIGVLEEQEDNPDEETMINDNIPEIPELKNPCTQIQKPKGYQLNEIKIKMLQDTF